MNQVPTTLTDDDTLGEQYIWEVARVKFSEDGDPFWFRPNEADLTTVKNNVVTG